jgi:hypothetical protein
MQLAGAQHLGGYLYGGFNDIKVVDKTMENQTKFHVPLSMFSRAEIESKVRAVQKKKVQCARLEYMRIPQIPSDSDDDEGDDNVENIRGLSLVRTPYFRIPSIHTARMRRIDRLKNNKFLKGNRLKRINMLLFDRKANAEKNKLKYAPEDGYLSPSSLNVGLQAIESPPVRFSKESSPIINEDVKARKKFESDYR